MEEIEYLEEYEDLIMPNAMNCIETASSGRTSVDSLDALYKELIAESEKLAKAQTQQTPQTNSTQTQATVADGLQSKPLSTTKCSTNTAPTAYTNVTSASDLQQSLYRSPANVSSSMSYLNSTSNKSFITGSSLHKPDKLKSVATVKPTLQRNNPTKNLSRKNVPPQRNAKPYRSTTGSFSARPKSSFGTKSASKTGKRANKTTRSRIDPLIETESFLDFDDDKNGLIDDFDFDSDLDNSINMGLSDMDSDSVDFSDDYSNFEFDSDLSSDGSLVKKSNAFNKSRVQNSSSQKHGQKPKNKPGTSFKRDATNTYKSKSSQRANNPKITSVEKLPNLTFDKSPNMKHSKKSFQFDKKESSTPHPATKNRRQSSNETASKPPAHFSSNPNDDKGKSSSKTSATTSAAKKSIPPKNESEWNRGILSKIVSPLKVPDKASALRPDTSTHNVTMENKNKKNDSISNAKVIESFSYDSLNKVVASSTQHKQAMPPRPDLLSPEKNGLPKIGLSYLRSIKPPASKVFSVKDSPHKVGPSTPQSTNEPKKNSDTPESEKKQKPNVAKTNTVPLSNKDETKVNVTSAEERAPAKKTLHRRKSLAAAREVFEESRARRKSRDHNVEESNSNVKPRERSRHLKSRESSSELSEQPVNNICSSQMQSEIVQNNSREDESVAHSSKYTVGKESEKVCEGKPSLEKPFAEQTTKENAVEKKATTILHNFKPKDCSVRLSKVEVALLLLKDRTEPKTLSPSSSHRASENVSKQKSSPSSKVDEFNSKESQTKRKVVAPDGDRNSGKSQSADMRKSISTTVGDPPPCTSEDTTTKSQGTLTAKAICISESGVSTEKPQSTLRRKPLSSTITDPSGSSTESTESDQNKTKKSEGTLKLNDLSLKNFETDPQVKKSVEETANKSQLKLRRKSEHSTKVEPSTAPPHETLLENKTDPTNKLHRTSKKRRVSTPNITASDTFLENAGLTVDSQKAKVSSATAPTHTLDTEEKPQTKQTRKPPAAKVDHQDPTGGTLSESGNDKTNSSESMLRKMKQSSLNNEAFEEASRTLSEPADATDQAQNASKRKPTSSTGPITECGQDTVNKPTRKTVSAKSDHQSPHTLRSLETDSTIESTSSSTNLDASDKVSKHKRKSMQSTGPRSENSRDVAMESQAEVDHPALAAGTVSECAEEVTNHSENALKRKSTSSSKNNRSADAAVVLPETHDLNKSQSTLKRKATCLNSETSSPTKFNDKAAVNKSPKHSLSAETQEMSKRPKISHDNVSPVREKNTDAPASTDEEIKTKSDTATMRKKRRFNLLTATPKALRSRKTVSSPYETNDASEEISLKRSRVQEETDSDLNERIVGHNQEKDTPKGTASKRLPPKIQADQHVQNISADESSSNEVVEATKQRSASKSPVKSNRSTSSASSPSPSPICRKLRKRPGKPIMGRNLRKYALKNISNGTTEPRKTLKSPPPRVLTKSNNCTPQKEKPPIEKTVTPPAASSASSTTVTKSPPAPVSTADPDMNFEIVQPKKEIFSDTVIFQCHPPSMNRSRFLQTATTSAKKPTLPTTPGVKPVADKPSASIAQSATDPGSIRTVKVSPPVAQARIGSHQKKQPDTVVYELPSYIVMKTKIITREELHNNKAFVPQLVQQTLEKLVEERQVTPEVKTERPEFVDVCLQINNLLGSNANYLKFASASERQSRMQQVLTDSSLSVQEAQCAFKFLKAYLSLRASNAGARAKNQKFIPIYDSQKKVIGYRKRTANSRRPSQQTQHTQLRSSVRQVANSISGSVQQTSHKAPAPMQRPVVTSGDILNVRTVLGVVSNPDSQFTTKTEPPTLDGDDDGNETIIPDATVAPVAEQRVKDETTETTVNA